MIRKDRDSDEAYLSDEEFAEIMKPFDDLMDKKTHEWLNEFIAYYVSTAYDMDAIWDTSTLEYEVIDALTTINGIIQTRKFDFDKIKEIMESKFKLKVINDDPIKIEKTQ